MKAADIQVGGKYVAKVNGRLVPVRVNAVREVGGHARPTWTVQKATRTRLLYDVTNLTTGRKTTFRSAAKFRSPVTEGR